jgi:hypothetical protein
MVCQKLEAAAHEVLMYMKINKLSPNEGKTQFLVFGREGARDIKAGEPNVSKSKTAVLLGAIINKTPDWYDHDAVLERELNKKGWNLKQAEKPHPKGSSGWYSTRVFQLQGNVHD